MRETLGALQFLVIAPLILAFLVLIDLWTSPGDWWVHWAALGLGIAWVICLLQVIRTAVILGGLTALGAYLWRRNQRAGDRTPSDGDAAGPRTR